MPLRQEQIIPAAQRLVSGESFDFASEKVAQNGWNQIGKTDGPFLQILTTILNQKGAECEQACAILTDDLKRFSPDKSLLEKQEILKEWLFKLSLGVYGHPFIVLQLHKSQDLDLELVRYSKVVEDQISVFKQTLSTLGKDDLPYYIHFADLFNFYGASGLFKTPVQDKRKGEADLLFATVASREGNLRSSFLHEDHNTWDRLRVDWRTEEIQNVVSLLPNIRSSAVVDNLVLALEDNLSDFSERSSLEGGEKLKIDLHGVIALLKWKCDNAYGRAKDIYARAYPRVMAKSDGNLEFANFSVPRRHLPHTAILLLTEAAKRSDEQEFTNLLEDINELSANQKITVPWFIVLLVLRANNPETSDFVYDTVSEFDTLSDRVNEIFLNRPPVKLWLRQT
jgi:hypothetical protein